jgi:hypothetical protein
MPEDASGGRNPPMRSDRLTRDFTGRGTLVDQPLSPQVRSSSVTKA